jgi:predicted RNA binding protein YcfA (HicA-like mRNA interferase family)
MPKLPHLSGKEVIKALSKAGFNPVRQKGSHVILVKPSPEGERALVVPLHREIDVGTLLEIIRQAGLKRDAFLKLL